MLHEIDSADLVLHVDHGFLLEQNRFQALSDFCALFALTVPQLEYLLALDNEEQATLQRESAQPPEAEPCTCLLASAIGSGRRRFLFPVRVMKEVPRAAGICMIAAGVLALVAAEVTSAKERLTAAELAVRESHLGNDPIGLLLLSRLADKPAAHRLRQRVFSMLGEQARGSSPGPPCSPVQVVITCQAVDKGKAQSD